MLIRGSTILALAVCALGACDQSNAEDKAFSEPRSATNTGGVVNALPGGVKPIDSTATAVNGAHVKHYSDEIPLTPNTSNVARFTTARTMPFGKEIVAVLENGGGATVLAQRGDYYLARFPDPEDPDIQLAGWIYKDGLTNVRRAPTAPGFPATMACRINQVQVLSEALCASTCTRDADCEPVGGICDGQGRVVATGSGSIERARYCISSSSR